MTTAEHRNRAWNFSEKKEYAKAYKEYDLAIKKYPVSVSKGILYKDDLKGLEKQKKIMKELMNTRL
jgi:hypothetical protein